LFANARIPVSQVFVAKVYPSRVSAYLCARPEIKGKVRGGTQRFGF